MLINILNFYILLITHLIIIIFKKIKQFINLLMEDEQLNQIKNKKN